MNDKREDNENSDEDNSRPTTPDNDDCCGNSCDPCIFDVHKKMLHQWERRKICGIRGKREDNFLSPLCYKIFVVAAVVIDAENFIRIRLARRRNDEQNSGLFLNPGQHVILTLGNTKSKPYTPILCTRNDLELLIKVYPEPSFSKDLANLSVGDLINVRGPYGDFEYKQNREIVAFCIGSGLAAIYPIAKSIVDNEIEETRIHIVAGFRTIAEIPLKRELRQLSDYWNVTCTVQLSNFGCDEIAPSGIEIRRGRLGESTMDRFLLNYSQEKTLIVICGTPEFNKSLKTWTKNRGFLNHYVFS